jgi:hypothetical protein
MSIQQQSCFEGGRPMSAPPSQSDSYFETLVGRIADVLRSKARLAARCGEGRHSWFLVLKAGGFHSEDPEAFAVASGPVLSAEAGELVGIDFDLNETIPLTTVQLLLTMEIEPFIIGVGQVKVRHTPEGLVILRSEGRKSVLGHDVIPGLSDISQVSAAGSTL